MNESARSPTSRVSYLGDSGAAHNFYSDYRSGRDCSLLSLGTWQVQRLAWKEGILAEIDAKISGTPTTLPLSPSEEAHKYQPVEVSGRFLETRIRVLVSQKLIGAGYRIIQPFQTADRVILIDRGFVKIDQTEDLRNDTATVLGNLHWPDEVDEYTPEPDLTRDIWFARDVPALGKGIER